MPAYDYDHSTPVFVQLQMHRGVADLVAEQRPDIQVEINPLDDTASSRENADAFRVTLDGDTLVIHAPEGFGWPLRRTPKIHVVARVPAGSSLAAKLASADLRARGDYGVVQIDTASGNAYVERVGGDCELKTASGDLQADQVGGSLRIGTASGDLRIGDVNGDVSATTASGDMVLRAVGGSLQCKTASGDVEVGRLRQGTASINSASGDVKVGVAVGTGVWLDLNTASGSTSSDLTAGAAAASDEQPALQLRVRTASGDVHIHRALGHVERENA